MIVTVDFETFYDDDYTVKKFSTSEYVRNPQFEVLCVGIKIDDQPTTVYWGDKKVEEGLAAIDWPNATLLCHHTHFDGLILSHHYKIVPGKYADTLSMARALNPGIKKNDLDTVAARYGKGNKIKGVIENLKGKHYDDLTEEDKEAGTEYCATDVDLTYELYMEMVKDYPPKELDVIHMIVRMFADPVLRLDVDRALKEQEREKTERYNTIAASGLPLETITKNAAFAAKLEEYGVTVPTKTSPTPPYKTIYAFAQTDTEFTSLVHHADPRVSNLVKGRLAAKSTQAGTRVTRMLRSGCDGLRLPIYINYCGAHTTRGSGGDKLNYQNLPRAEYDAQGNYLPPSAELRRSILAPEDHVIVVVDSSQNQARLTAWLAEEEWLLDAFRNKRDPYSEFASIAYGRTITKADKLERFIGKICVLALSFGMGAEKLQYTLATGVMGPAVHLELVVCQKLVNTYRYTNKKIKQFWEFCNNRIIPDMILGREGTYKCLSWGKEHVKLPNGLHLHYPDLRGTISKGWDGPRVSNASYATHRGRAKIYGGLMTENLAQALERVSVYDQALEIDKRYKIVMQCHDENPFIAPIEEADEALAFGIEVMSTPPAWGPDIPFAAEGGYDVCYSK